MKTQIDKVNFDYDLELDCGHDSGLCNDFNENSKITLKQFLAIAKKNGIRVI